MNLTDAQLSRLRTRPHSTKLWLSIFQPQEVIRAQINQVNIAKGDRDITVTLISGIATSVLSGMTVYIGTTAGAKDLGRLRVKAATATTITVAENSVNWVNGWYLTIVRYFEPWGIYPRIVLDAENVPTSYKDFDVVYTDQNHLMDPVVCMGPNHAVMLAPTITGSYAQVYYSSSGSFDPTPGGSITTYGWHLEGGAPTGSASADPGYVTYTGCGHYVTSLTLTTSNGKTLTGRRHISILARPEREQDGDCKPISKWGLEDLSGSRDAGGWKADLWVREAIGTEDIPDGSMAVIFSEEDREGYVGTKIGANSINRDTILFVGYVDGQTIEWDPETNKVNFTAEGLSAIMDKLTTFSVALDDSLNAMNWNQMREMTVDRAIIHYLRWHSTILAVADFSRTYDTKPLFNADFSRGSIFKNVDSFLEGTLIGQAVSDRQGKLWTEVDARVLTTGSARQVADSMQNVLSITRQDWRDRVFIKREPQDPSSFLELGGIGYPGPYDGSGSSNLVERNSAHLSGAPGVAPGYYGKTERNTGLVILGQAQLNELTGHAWAAKNADFPEVLIPMAGDYRFLDITPQHRILMNLPAADNWLRVAMVDKPFILEEIVYSYEADKQVLLMDLKLKEETSGLPGDTIDIPVDPPYDYPGLDDIDFPPIFIPPPIPVPSETPIVSTGRLVYICTPTQLVRSRNFGAGTLGADTDFTNITPLPTSVTGTFISFHLDPIDPLNVAYLVTDTGSNPNGPFIYRTMNLNSASPTWAAIMTPTQWRDAHAAGGGAQSVGQIADVYAIGISRLDRNNIYAAGRYAGATSDRMRVARTGNGGTSWNDKTDGDWADGVGNPSPDELQVMHASEHTSNRAHATRSHSTNVPVLYTDDLGDNWTKVVDGIHSGTSGEVNDLEIPYNNNALDRLGYWSEGRGTTKHVFIASDNFATPVDITPTAQAQTWGVGGAAAPAGVTNFTTTDGYRCIRTWDQNSLFVAMLLRRNMAGADENALTGYFTAIDGQTLNIRVTFNGIVSCLWWNKNNVNQLYAIGLDDDVDRAIYLTEDGGITWMNLFQSWYDDILGGVGLNNWQGNNQIPFTIQNVWTI